MLNPYRHSSPKPTNCSAADRWQRVHDKELDLALSCKDDAYKMDAYVDVAILVSKHLHQLQPVAWAKIKAYWAGL